MAASKSFQGTSFWASAGLISITSELFLLAGSHYQPQRLHQRQTRHSGSSRKDIKIYRVCLSAQGQTEGLGLSALLGEAAELQLQLKARQTPHRPP